MADSMNATLSDPTFEKKEDLNAPVSNPEHLHNTEETIKVTPEISDAEPKFVEVSKKEFINVKEAADNVKEVAGNVKEAAGKFAAKNVAEMKKLLPTNFLRRALSFIMYFGIVIPILTIMNTFVFGLKQEGKGKIQKLSKKNKGFVLTCNHVHPMDCTWLGVLTTPRKMVYTSMEGNFKIPVVGPFIRFFDCVPISTTIKGLRNFMNEMTDAVKRGRVVGMYPEGSIEMYCDHLRKFSDGAFTIAVDANAPVLPVVITPRERKGLWKLLKRSPCITLTVGDPVYPEDCGSHRKTVRKLREDVEAEMNHLLEIGGKAYPTEPLHDEEAFWRTDKKSGKTDR
ncbi:MAG: lysophospholipid acyltransferase family protein [Acutalibacteraceae bacterium]|nr:lysophospholipid acyltransferase family protein [Acutalibacteraceae bacterium]